MQKMFSNHPNNSFTANKNSYHSLKKVRLDNWNNKCSIFLHSDSEFNERQLQA